MSAANLSGTNTGDVTVSTFGSSPNASGASITGQALTLQPADATNPGGVSTTTQTFAGNKTFANDVVITGDLTVNGTTTTLNTATLDVEDVNITINNGGNDASSEGAGLTVERTATNATLLHENALASKWKCGASGSESEILTAGTTQTISGIKTFTAAPTFEEEGSTPSTPASGYRKLYAKSGGFYELDSLGVERELGSGGSGSGGINYIDAADGTAIGVWVTYDDGASSTPVNGTGGSPGVTYAISTDSSLRGTSNFLFTHDAADRQGEGFSYDFTIDASDKGKVLQCSFEYLIASGTYADDDLQFWIYDVTNSTLIQPAPYKLKNSSIVEKFAFEFQTSSSSTSYRLIAHVSTTTATAYTIRFDNWSLGPQAKLYGSPVTDETAYTPTITNFTVGNGSVAGYWSKRGDKIFVRGVITLGSTSAITGNLAASTPSGVTLNTTNWTASYSVAGARFYDSSAGVHYNGAVQPSTSTSVLFFTLTDVVVSQVWNATTPVAYGTGDQIAFSYEAPVSGWSSSVVVSSDASTRVISCHGHDTGGTTYNSNAARQQIPLDTTIHDTHGMISGNIVTIPVNGYYELRGKALWTGANMSSGATYTLLVTTSSVGGTVLLADDQRCAAAGALVTNNINGVRYLTAGTTLYFVVTSTANHSVSTVSIDGTSTYSYLMVTQVQGPSQIAASETVAALYTGAPPTGTLNSSYNTTTFGTKVKDTHNAYSSGTYTVPSSGTYSISAQTTQAATYTAGQFGAVSIHVNGTNVYTGVENAGGANGTLYPLVSVHSIPLLAGDLVTIRSANSGTTPTFSSTGFLNYFSIVRTGNY
jgi:hypothetical protein